MKILLSLFLLTCFETFAASATEIATCLAETKTKAYNKIENRPFGKTFQYAKYGKKIQYHVSGGIHKYYCQYQMKGTSGLVSIYNLKSKEECKVDENKGVISCPKGAIVK